MVKKASSTTYMNGTTSGIKDAKPIVWSRGARIAASYFSKRDTNKIHDVVNQFNAKSRRSYIMKKFEPFTLENHFIFIFCTQKLK